MQAHLSVTVREHDQTVVVEVEGELDLASSPRLELALEDAQRKQPGLMVLDLAGLRFIDMAGLRVLLGAQQQAERHGNRLVLAHVPDPIRRVLNLASVSSVLTILENAS